MVFDFIYNSFLTEACLIGPFKIDLLHSKDVIPLSYEAYILQSKKEVIIILSPEEKTKVIQELHQHFEKNISLINFMRDYDIQEVQQVGQSKIIRGTSDREWVYLALESESDMPAVLEAIKPTDTCFAMVSDFEKEALLANATSQWILSCKKLIFPSTKPLNVFEISLEGAILRNLQPSEADYIFEHYDYKAFTTPEYIQERIERGPSFGFEKDGTLIAWLLTHDDGAMGMLTVLDAYRKHGLGAALTVKMIDSLRAMALLPFVAIEPSNEKSLNLSKKFGFEEVALYHWFERNQ